MYIAATISNSVSYPNMLDFAMSHAVTLAEAGETTASKRIGLPFSSILRVENLLICYPGYLFCSELMPADHELQLMLVNTIQKVTKKRL